MPDEVEASKRHESQILGSRDGFKSTLLQLPWGHEGSVTPPFFGHYLGRAWFVRIGERVTLGRAGAIFEEQDHPQVSVENRFRGKSGLGEAKWQRGCYTIGKGSTHAHSGADISKNEVLQ